MIASALIKALDGDIFDNSFKNLYPSKDISERKSRYKKLAENFLSLYGDKDVFLFSVPGRTELAGNHTDHNNGRVLAAAVDIDIIAVAAKTDENIVRMKSEGYREDVVDISSPTPEDCRKGSSSAIISGIADYFDKNGYKKGGFCAYTTSEVMTGSGLSSSAAFEVICAKIFSTFYNEDKVGAMELAKAGQYAENVFFGKPCGLMDQAACAFGGCLWIDFEDPKDPKTENLTLDLAKYGYKLVIVNTGGNHADLTDDYASVPAEMKNVAALMGKPTLRFCDEADFVSRISYLRAVVGDRAVMRALHFFAENKRVDTMKEALKQGDISTYFENVKASGNSSFKFLQNVYTVSNVQEQGLSLALAISERLGVVCRVHGGGFAGTIQSYVPGEKLDSYVRALDLIFGEGSSKVYSIRPFGAFCISEEK